MIPRMVPRPDHPSIPYLTIAGVAEFMGVTQGTVRKWIDRGRLPAYLTMEPGPHRVLVHLVDVRRLEAERARIRREQLGPEL